MGSLQKEKKKIQLKTPEHASMSIKDNDFLLVATVTNCWHKGRWLQRFFPSFQCSFTPSLSLSLSFFPPDSLSFSALLPGSPKCKSCTDNRKPKRSGPGSYWFWGLTLMQVWYYINSIYNMLYQKREMSWFLFINFATVHLTNSLTVTQTSGNAVHKSDLELL